MADDLGNISRPLLESGIGAVIYFVSFVALSSILVLNVIVGVVVDSMEEIRNTDRNRNHSENLLEEIGVSAKKNESDELGDADVLEEIENLEQQLDRLKKMVVSKAKK